MGDFVSTRAQRAKERSGMIDQQIQEDKIRIRSAQREVKILSLGSGMETIINQMKTAHGFSDTELAEYRPVIYDNLLDSVQSVLRYMKRIDMRCTNYANQACVEKILDYRLDKSNGSIAFNINIAEAIHCVWNDPVIPDILENHSSEFYLMESAPYFCSEVMRIGSPGYLPNERDILKTRQKTAGITETMFYVNQMPTLRVFDISGQRSQSKKWIHYFQGVAFIFFCAPLSDYDQISESLDLFESVVNSRWFLRLQTSIILFLTKVEVFKHKISKAPLEQYFPEYTGGSDTIKAAKYIRQKFKQLNRAKLLLYPHFVKATAAMNIWLILPSVKDAIFRKAEKDAELL